MNEMYTQLIKQLINENKVDRKQIWSFVNEQQVESTEPILLKKEMENWYIGLGINDITETAFSLDDCPFSKEEIDLAIKNEEMILCVPKNLTKKQLGKLFRIESWAFEDELVEESREKNDLWFKTEANPSPGFIRENGIDVTRKFRRERKVLFSLEIYLVFIARYRFLFNQTPDSEYWIWICKGRYDRSGMLIAGFDRNKKFNVHGWMPQFSAGFLGARYGVLPKKNNG